MQNKHIQKQNVFFHKAKDYSYTILFFLCFSFFAFFIIRPNIITIFSLQEELGKLKNLDATYEVVIQKIVNIQTFLEGNRSDLYLMDQALPPSPQINTLVDQIQRAASDSGIVLSSMEIGQTELKKEGQGKIRKKISVHVNSQADYQALSDAIRMFMNDRRLKEIRHLIVNKQEAESSTSGKLGIILELEGYYL